MPRVIGGRYGLSSKEFTPGHGRRRVRRARARAAAAAVHRSGSTTTSRGTSLAYDRVAGHRAAGHRARGVLRPRARTGRSARTRTRSRSSAPRRTCTPRATSSTTRRSRARRPSRTCASGRGRSARPTSCAQASFVGCHQFGLLERVDVLDRAAPGATLLLNCRARRRTRSGTRCRARCRSRSSPSDIERVRDRRRADRPRGRASPGGSTPSCRPASSRSPACCRASEAIERIKAAIAKTYGKRGAEVVERNQRGGRPRARGPAPGRGARAA